MSEKVWGRVTYEVGEDDGCIVGSYGSWAEARLAQIRVQRETGRRHWIREKEPDAERRTE